MSMKNYFLVVEELEQNQGIVIAQFSTQEEAQEKINKIREFEQLDPEFYGVPSNFYIKHVKIPKRFKISENSYVCSKIKIFNGHELEWM